jgi:transcriptional regulator with XRE-family HTH domain
MSFFGQNIRFLRNSRQMSQSAFAEVFGLKRTAVGAYEEERAEPKVDLFVKIANYFGISLEDLVCRSLAEGDNVPQTPSERGVPYVCADEIADFAKAVSDGVGYAYRQFIQIPGFSGNMIAMQFGRSILIVGERDSGRNLFDDGSRGRTLLLKRSGIAISNGNFSDAEALKVYDIRYIIKCFDKDDHAETMLEDISERLARMEQRMG